MDLLSYALALIASLGLMGVGGLVLPGAPPGRRFVAGLAMVGGVCGALAWLAPLAILPLCRVAVALGWVVLLNQLRRGWRPAVPDRKALVQALLAAGLGVAMTLHYHYRFIELGPNYYFGHFVEYYLADYTGPLRIPVFYPWESAATHLLASTVLAAMGALLRHGTMLDAIELRFLLVAFVVARFCYVVMRRSGRGLAETALLLAAALLAFHFELNFSIRESSFIYIALISELALVVFFEQGGQEDGVRDALFLLLAMVGAKASIFYVPGLAAAWLVLRFPRMALHPAVVAAGLVTLVQLAITAMRPKPFADVSIKLTLVNITGGRAGFDHSHTDAVFNVDLLARLFSGSALVAVAVALAILAVKYWLVPIRAMDGYRAGARAGEFRELVRAVEVFLLVVVLALVFVRYDQHGTTHLVWPIYGTAPLVMAAILARALQSGSSVGWRLGLVLYAGAALAGGYWPWPGFNSPESPHLGGVTHHELARMTDAEALTPRPGEDDSKLCERALLKGLRMPAATSNPAVCAGFAPLLVEPRK